MSFFHNIQQDFNNISRTFHAPPPPKPPVITIQPIAQPFKQPPIIPPSHFIPIQTPQPLKPILDPILQQITPPNIVAPPTIQQIGQQITQRLQQTTPPHIIAPPTIKQIGQQITQRLQQTPPQSTFSNFLDSDSSYILYGLAGLGIIIYVFNKN
jgi:hypothetical protein